MSEDCVNRWGYSLHAREKHEAIGVFQLNAGLYPVSASAYGSLVKAYEANGERELAISEFSPLMNTKPH